VSAGLDPEARDEALACIHREIHDLVANGPRPGELERAKRLVIAQSKLGFEATAVHAAWAGEGVMDFYEIPSLAQWRERIANVTDAAIQQAASLIFLNQQPAHAEIGGPL
jgi:predicted Zn-dependent peptidase